MGKYRDRMTEDLALRQYRPSTCRNYMACVKGFIGHFMQDPEELGEEEIRKFLLHLKEEKASGPANVKMYVAAIKFFYTHTLRRPSPGLPVSWQIHAQGRHLQSQAHLHERRYRFLRHQGQPCHVGPGP